MNKLQSLSCNTIRLNFPLYKNDISEHISELIYSDWLQKNPIPHDSISQYEPKIKNFLLNDDNLSIVIINRKERLHLHKWCNKMGVIHESSGNYKNRTFNMIKPEKWKWEFSNNELKEKKRKKIQKKMINIFCENCNVNDCDQDLYIHYSGMGPYCEECLHILKTDDDVPLWAYKFEPISYCWK